MNAYAIRKELDEVQPEWLAAVAPHLDQVERCIEMTIASDVPAAYDLSMHLLAAGGKRIRPALAVLSALSVNPQASLERTINFATSAELVHMASLVHDDVVDETSERRGTSTANSVWGNKMSVLGGDFLLSKAFSLLCRDGDSEIIRILSNTAVGMTEGELLQASSEGDLVAWQAHYWDIIKGKTAVFMGACCECGAVIAGADSSTRLAMAEYGLQIGLAFQITDDLLDIVGDPAVIGKEIGTDLIHGKFTLPVLYALENMDPKERAILLTTYQAGMSRDYARQFATRVASSEALDRAKQAAIECAQRALMQLSGLADSKFRAALETLAESVVRRKL